MAVIVSNDNVDIRATEQGMVEVRLPGIVFELDTGDALRVASRVVVAATGTEPPRCPHNPER